MVSLPCLAALLLAFLPTSWNGSQASQDERLLGGPPLPGHTWFDRFRNNMLVADEPAHVHRLVDQLGDDDFRVREKAFIELSHWRPGAEVLLRQRAKSADLEMRRRVDLLIAKGLGRWSPLQAEAAARLVKRSFSLEGARTLIDYFPFADDPGVELEIASTLKSWAADADVASAIRTELERHPASSRLSRALKGADDPSPTIRAADKARQFFANVAQADMTALVELTQLPFALGNGVLLRSPGQRDEFFSQAVQKYRDDNPHALFTFLQVARGEDYLRFADDTEREHLSHIPSHELRAVYVRMRRDWNTEETGVVLVRVTDDGAWVTGLGYAGVRAIRIK